MLETIIMVIFRMQPKVAAVLFRNSDGKRIEKLRNTAFDPKSESHSQKVGAFKTVNFVSRHNTGHRQVKQVKG